jgi:ATP:ADP antiporter, AAA family
MPSAVALATLSGALVIAQHIMAKAMRDSLFLSNFQATTLPNAVFVTAIVTLPAVMAGSRLTIKFGPQRFFCAFLLLNAIGFAGEWFALPAFPRWVAGLLYVHVGLFGGIAVSGFWSVINERFDPHSARQAFARISTGVTVGGLLGGVLAERLATWFGVRAMFVSLAATNFVIVLAMLGVGRGQPTQEDTSRGPSGLQTLSRSAYLQRLALLVVMAALSASMLDYVFKSSVAASLGNPERLAKFFAIYYMTAGFVTVLVQSTATRYTLKHLGIGSTLAVLPAALLCGGALNAVTGGLAAIVLLRGAEAVLSNSFFRSGYEPMYTPLPPRVKRGTKAIVDVAASRVGDALASAGIMVALAITPHGACTVALVVVMVAAVVSLVLSRQLQQGYVLQLATSLRKGIIRLADGDVRDATTRLTLSQTHGEVDRGQVLRELEALHNRHTANPEVIRLAAELASGESERIVGALETDPLDKQLVGLVLPLLGYEDTRIPSTRALQGIAAEIVGQLGDALCDTRLAVRARSRVPALLAKVPNARAVSALIEGLSDPEFDLRQRCARALLSLRLKDPELSPPETTVFTAVRRELALSPATVQSPSTPPDADEPAPKHVAELKGDRTLQHVFTLLCLRLDPDAMALALRALRSDDKKLRGTALEYLDNVIPVEIKPTLLPRLTEERPLTRAAARSIRELHEELTRTLGG